MGEMKYEWLSDYQFITRAEAKSALFEYIEIVSRDPPVVRFNMSMDCWFYDNLIGAVYVRLDFGLGDFFYPRGITFWWN